MWECICICTVEQNTIDTMFHALNKAMASKCDHKEEYRQKFHEMCCQLKLVVDRIQRRPKNFKSLQSDCAYNLVQAFSTLTNSQFANKHADCTKDTLNKLKQTLEKITKMNVQLTQNPKERSRALQALRDEDYSRRGLKRRRLEKFKEIYIDLNKILKTKISLSKRAIPRCIPS